ncbi:MAG: polysaccharide deacetylase family protein [Actinobacteria bacterium]|nr:polysaccharide deacetylase family protein [Actinomycetota bacterium]
MRALTVLLVVGGCAVLAAAVLIPMQFVLTGRDVAQPATSATVVAPQASTSRPVSPAQQMLEGTELAKPCAVSFVGDGITERPSLQEQGTLFANLPVPKRDGAVFAGWYATAADAASFAAPHRVNGADVVVCPTKLLTLYGAWETPAEVTADAVKVPILMYHQFTDKPAGEKGWLRLNYDFIGAFDENMTYLADNQFYYPTWDELEAFIDGKLALPHHSVIVSDDDADATWLAMAVPVVEKYKVLSTSFVITSARHEGSPSMYVQQRSHTDDMHSAGANGKGKMVNFTVPQIVADLEKSAEILHAKEVIAYPYGHYNATAEEGVHEAGFDMAVTIDGGYVTPGANKLALPRVRMNYGATQAQFIAAVG